MNTKQIIFFLSTILFVSCEFNDYVEIDYEYLGYKPQISIHGYISSNSGVIAEVIKTANPLNIQPKAEDLIIPGIQVFLLAEEQEIAKLEETQPGIFATPKSFKPEYNVSYSIKAKAEKYPTAVTEAQFLPTPAKIDSLVVDFDIDNQLADIKVLIRDIGKEINYYALKTHLYFSELDSHKEKLGFPLNIIADYEFEGGKYSFVKSIYLTYFHYEWRGSGSYHEETYLADSLKITICSLSPDIIKFIQSLSDYDFFRGDIFVDTPPQVFSNVQGGVGFFSATSDTSIVINVKNNLY